MKRDVSSAPRADTGIVGSKRRLQLILAVIAAYVCVVVVLLRRQAFEVPLPQFLLGEYDLINGSRITSEFLPVGYPLLLAAGHLLGRAAGERGIYAAMCALNVGIAVAIVLCIYRWLSAFTTRGYALAVAFAIGLYPESIRNLTKISDTNLTSLLLLGLLLAFTALQRKSDAVSAGVCGLILGAATLVRPNLFLYLLLTITTTSVLTWKKRAYLTVVVVGTTFFFYGAVTSAVHGKPFLPKNGPYNLFAGANNFSERSLLDWRNAEWSIVPALQQLGMHPVLHWHQPSDQPGIDDPRDLRYAPIYRAAVWQFMRQHPMQMLRLTGIKLVTLLRPDLAAGLPAPWTNSWLAIKTVLRMAVPLWLVVVLLDWWRGSSGRNTLVCAMTILYVVPFLLTNSDPRFRTPLDILLLADVARIVYQWRRPEAQRAYLTSLPRPEA